MSKQEKNLTKAEKVVLSKLNVKAALILQVEEIFSEAKIPMDVSLLAYNNVFKQKIRLSISMALFTLS